MKESQLNARCCTIDAYRFGQLEGVIQRTRSLRYLANSAHQISDYLWKFLTCLVLLFTNSFTTEHSATASEDGLFQCDFQLSGAAVFTPDGRWLVGYGEKKTNKIESVGLICVWDVKSRKLVQKLSPYNVSTSDIAISNNGRWLGTFGGESVAHLWSIENNATGKTSPLTLAKTYRHYALPPKTVVDGGLHSQVILAPSSREFATVGSRLVSRIPSVVKYSIKLWPTPDAVSTSKLNFGSSANTSTRSTGSSLPPSGGSSTSTTIPGDAEGQSGDQPRLTIPIEDWPTDITYSPDGKLIVMGMWYSPHGKQVHPEVHFFDSETGSLKNKWILPGTSDGTHFGFDGSLVFSPDGTHLLICLAGPETAEIWHVESQRAIWHGHSRTGFRSGAFSSGWQIAGSLVERLRGAVAAVSGV